MDQVDRHILSRLATDGRYKFTQLASELNLSETAVRLRVRSLQEDGVVQIVALCNPLIMGHRGVRLIVELEGRTSTDIVEEFTGLTQVNQIATSDDDKAVYLDITCRDLDQLVDVLDSIRQVPNVVAIRPFVLTRLFKDYSSHGLVGSRGQGPQHRAD